MIRIALSIYFPSFITDLSALDSLTGYADSGILIARHLLLLFLFIILPI